MTKRERSRSGPANGATRCTRPTWVGHDSTLTERIRIGGGPVADHDGQIPETDITTISGARWTSPLRTLVEVAPDIDADDLATLVDDCLRLGAFSLDEAWARLAEPDMADRPGAEILRSHLRDRG